MLRTHQQASQEIQKELKEREEQMGMLTEKAKEYKVNVEEGERREEALKVKIVAVESRKYVACVVFNVEEGLMVSDELLQVGFGSFERPAAVCHGGSTCLSRCDRGILSSFAGIFHSFVITSVNCHSKRVLWTLWRVVPTRKQRN